ncbi:hypothetical protein [Nostoc sp.]|uniref:hypothetical protein n=1 Tax=Nostoc sp. TaxID=1180 RepID=UPI002FF74D86
MSLLSTMGTRINVVFPLFQLLRDSQVVRVRPMRLYEVPCYTAILPFPNTQYPMPNAQRPIKSDRAVNRAIANYKSQFSQYLH